MNASLWQLAGWTMIHSLWLGAAVALVGGFLRLACRRATPNARYAISLATLALLAATPIAAAGWLSANGVPIVESILPPPPGGEGWGGGLNQLNAHHLSLTLPLDGSEPEVGLERPRPAIIDLAQATPAELDALAAQQQSPQAIPTPSPAPLPRPPSPLPLHPSDHQSPITSHLSPLIPHLPTLWLIGAPLTFTLLATGLVGSERLRRRATPLTAGPAFDACERLRQTLTITRRVALAVCDDVAQPILVGIVRPLILLPAAALAGWTPEQLDMVLLHELAHVRRWDNLVNLLQRIVESLLFFHPAVWLVSRQVRRDREECCDAAVIRHTDRPHQYAELLVSIAAALRGGPAPSLAVASAMASHPLAGRIRRILNIEAEPMRITRRTLAATLVLPLLLAGAIFYSGASAEDSPPAKEQSSEAAAGYDANESTSLNNAKEPSEASARAKLIDDKLEEGAASVRRVYPIPPGTLVDPIELAKAIQSRHPVEIDWVEHQQAIVVSATEDVHERVAALIKKSAAKTAKFTDDTFRPIMAHNLVDGDNAPLIGGYGILEKFAADADPSTIDAAIERLKAEKRSFSVEQSDNGSKRIVDQTPPAKKPTIAMPLIIKEAPTQDKHLQELFTATYVNPIIARKYRVPPGVRQALEDMFDGLEKDPYGPQISFHRVWSGDDRTIEITAPTEAHLQYFNLIFGVLSLEGNVRQRENAQSAESPTVDAQDEISQLQNKIRNLESLVVKAQDELVNFEVYKDIIGQSGHPGAGELEAAIAAELDKDPTLNAEKQKLFELNTAYLTALASTKNPNSEEIKRLRATILQAETELAKHAQKLSKETRAKLSHIPNKAKEKVEAEYNDRYKAAKDNLDKHQRELAAARTRLLQVVPTANASPDAGAQTDSNSPQADLRTVLADTKSRLQRQLADLKARAEEAEGTEAERAAASALEAKILEWEVINQARGALRNQRADATGSNANAGGPGSPNQGGAATRSNADNAQTTANASPNAVPLAHKPETPANDSANAPVDSANSSDQEVEKLRRLFQESASNEQITKFYTVPQGSRQELETGIGVAAGKLFGSSKPPFQLKWEPDEDALYVTASELAHRGYFHVAFAAHKLSQFGHPPDAKLPEYQAALAELEKANADAARAMEGLPPAHLPPSPFPTLENQKIADRAYKLLGLELEPLTPEELERVKKLGYNGGLRVVAIDPNKQKFLLPNNLLVGLHVWPITDLQSLDAVLTREDLDELSPLKFRAATKLDRKSDELVAGRMPIDLEAFRSIRRSLPPDHTNAAKAPPSAANPASDFDAISVIQAPISQKTSIFGGTVTTAYLRVKFNRLPYSVDASNGRLSPQEIERNSMNCLALVKSPAVMKAALKSFTPRDVQDLSQDQAVLWLLDRLSVTFPGDGEIMELKLEGGDAKEDAVLLQGVIDAFLAAMKAPPESPADPNAAVPPGDLNRYIGRDVTPAPAIADYQHPALFAKALERSRKSSKPVIVHLLALSSDPSEQFANNILADPQVADFIHKNFDAITLYPEYHPAFAKAFHINRVPADMFIYAGGERIAGGVTPPATPELYLAHLKTHHKLATSTAIQNGDASLVPAAPIAPAADHPANDQKPAATVDAGDAVSLKVAGAFPEAPLDGVFTIEPAGTLPLGPLYGRVVVAGKTVLEAEAAVKEHLSRTLTDVAVQLTLGPNPATTAEASPPAAVSSPTFLYDGKTFNQWRDLWKLELNPERRIEAINALATLGKAGYGAEAADAILDVAAQYDLGVNADSAEGKLIGAIDEAVTHMPADLWMPRVQAKIKDSDDAAKKRWRAYARQFLLSAHDKRPEARIWAAKFAADPADGLLNVTATYLLQSDQNLEDPLTVELARKALHERVEHEMIYHLLRFRNLDKVPEQLDALVRNHRARNALQQTMQQDMSEEHAPELIAPMLAILNDPNRADDHVGAIRTLKAMYPALRRRSMQAERLQVVEQLTTILRDGPDELLLPACAALGHLTETSADSIPAEYLQEGKISAERAKRLREFDQQELIDEANAD